MSKTQPVQARSEKTRARILEVALDLLVEQGPGAVTHRAVSKEAGVSLGATTYYFGTRAELLDEVYRVHLAQVRERAQESLTGYREAASPADALIAYLERDLREGRKGSLAAFELSLARGRDPALRRRLRPARNASGAFASEALGELGSKSPELDSELLVAALMGLKLEYLAEGERSAFAKRLPQLLERLAEVLLPK